jgi:EAL domain-containing protein (putative c-di-GMP-specific phosphodiesterase class I)
MDKFCFELNETATIHDLNDAAEFMHELRKLGCKFVLSDFGTGQSSYNFLKQLPVDFVKIDRNFIDGLRSSSADYALIKSIQESAQFMAKKTIAEHSENELTWDILRGIGIDFGVTSVKQAIALEDLTET